MYPGVKSVSVAMNHKLILEFDNGESRIFDVGPLLTVGRFQALTSPQVFRKVKVAFDTVEWENGLDLDPEYLYERSEPVSCEQVADTPASTHTADRKPLPTREIRYPTRKRDKRT